MASFTVVDPNSFKSSGVNFKDYGDYVSQYASQIKALADKVGNRQEFSYNPLEDANYQNLAKVYNANGMKAMQDTLGQTAALNGGFNSSWATSAAAQARNDYNQQLAALIPELEKNAYDRYANNYQMDISGLGALQGLDDSAYNQFNGNRNYNLDLGQANLQKWNAEKGIYLDAVSAKNSALQLKKPGGSGGGGRSGGGGSYGGGSYTSTSNPYSLTGGGSSTNGAVSKVQATASALSKLNSKKK